MAGPTVKEILVKWGIDTSSWKSAIQQLGKLLDDQNKKAAAGKAAAVKEFAAQIDAVQDLLSISKKQSQEVKNQTAAVTSLAKQYELIVDTNWDQVAVEKAITAEIQKQILLRKSSGLETVKSGKLAGGISGKAAKVVFDQQGAIANSIKAVIVELHGEVTKFLSVEKLVTKELQKQQSVINAIRRAPALGTRVGAAPAAKALIGKVPVAAAPVDLAIAQLNAKKALGTISTTEEAKARATILAMLQKEIAAKTQSTVHTKQEVAEIQKLSRLAKQFGGGGKPPGKPPKEGGGGIFDNFFSFLGLGTEGEKAGKGGFVEGLFGGFASKMAGTIGFAVLSAEGLGRVLERVYEQLKDLILESDKFANVWKTFENLTSRTGAGPEEFMEQLQESTHGLVANSNLAAQANRVLMQGVSISTAEINKLTRTVSDLARAQGIDATQAQEEMNRALASGRLQSLAYSLGLEHAVREQLNITSSLPESIRLTTEYAIVQEAAQKQLLKTGAPIETIGTAIKRANVALGNFFEDIALKASQTEGANNLAKVFNDIAKALGNKDTIAGFASVVDKVMGAMAEWFTLLKSGWEVLKEFGGVIGALAESLMTVARTAILAANAIGILNDKASEKMLSGYSSGWAIIGTVLKNIGHALGEVTAAANQVSKILKLLKDNIIALGQGDIVGVLEQQREYFRDLYRGVRDYFQAWYDGWFKVSKLPPPELWTQIRPKSAEPPTAEGATALAGQDVSASETTDEAKLREAEDALADFQYKLKLKKEEAELTKVIEEGKFQDIKASLEKQKVLYDELYKNGSVSLRQSVEENKRIRVEETTAEIANLEKQKAAQISLANFEQSGIRVDLQRARLSLSAAAKGKTPQELRGDADYESKKKNVKDLENIERDQNRVRDTKSLEIDNKIRAARAKLNLDLIKEDFKLSEDQITARKATVAALEKLDREQLAQRTSIAEYEFKEGAISADKYLDTRIKLAEKERDIAVQSAEDTYLLGVKDDASRAQRDNKRLEAASAFEKTITELQLNQLDIRTRAAEEASNRIKSVLEAQLAQQEDLGKINPFQTRSGEIATINSLIAAERQRLEVLRQQVELQKDEPEAQAKTRVEIEKTEQSLHGYRDKLIEISDMSKDIASEARNMATAAGLFPKGSKTAQGLEKFAQITETIGKLNADFFKSIEAQKGISSKPLTPEEVYEALKKSSDIAGDSLQQLAEDAKEKVESATASVRDSLVDKFALALDATTEVVYRFRDALLPKSDENTGKGKSLGGRAAGGAISSTGLYTMHAGEYVLPTSMAAVFNAFIKALANFTKTFEPKAAAVKPAVLAAPIHGVSPTTGTATQPNPLKEFFLALQNFGRVLVGKKPVFSKPIEERAKTGSPGKPKTTVSPEKVKPDTNALEENLKSLTDSINKLTQAIQPANKPLGTPSSETVGKALSSGDTPLLGGPGALSGLPTPKSPEGVMTDSDKQDLDANLNANTSSGLGNAQGTSDSLLTLAQSAQTAAQALAGVADSGTAKTSQDAGASSDQGGDAGPGGGLKGQMDVLSKGISSVMGMVGGVMQTFKTTGAFQGAAAGAASFGQIGAMIGGPIGGAIGAVVGGITGAISGAMRAATERMAERMVAAFQAIIQEVQTGNQTLGAGISLSIQQIQTTVSSLSGRKGGRDDLKQILPNMEQELAQLQAQQKQVLQSMDQQVSALNAPLAYQSQLQSINQIVTAYQQYIQAGGNVVTANQYLQDSFQNLETQGMQQLNQDEQDAVNNALNYNNLLLQRQTLIQDTNQQIQDIMSQGVAVRQMPEGVTKARQIQQLMLNSSQQMDQLNQQISVSQYQLNVQQQIFGLATTRIGLENQLVVLQNEQTNYSMQQIAALGNVLGQFQTKLPTSMQAALQQLGLGAGFVNPSTEPGLKPVPPVKTGISQIDLQNQLQYQQALSAWQLSQNFPIGYIPPSGNVSTTPVPTTIGNPGVYGANQGLPNSVWLTPGTTSILGTATGAATSLNTMGSAFGQLPTTIAGTMAGSLGIPPTLPSVPGLTINGTQVDTVSTPAGQALLVSPSTLLGGETATRTQTGPGTTQPTGIVGTASMAAAATNSIFGALAGFPATAMGTTTFTPLPAAAISTTTAPVSAPTSPIRFPTRDATTSPLVVTQPPPGTAPVSAFDMALQMTPASIATSLAKNPPPGAGPAIAIQAALTSQQQAANNLVTTSLQRVTAESQISQLSNSRIAAESALVSMKMTEIQADMRRVQAHNDLMTRSLRAGTTSTSLEDLLQNLYDQRGRQGFGNFYGEISNPT